MSRQMPQDSTNESVGGTDAGVVTLDVALGVTKSITVGNRVLGVKGTKTESDNDIENGLVSIQWFRPSGSNKEKQMCEIR